MKFSPNGVCIVVVGERSLYRIALKNLWLRVLYKYKLLVPKINQ